MTIYKINITPRVLFILLMAICLEACKKESLIITRKDKTDTTKTDTTKTPPPVTPPVTGTVMVTTVAGQRNELFGQIHPTDLAYDASHNIIYISDPFTNTLTKIGSDGVFAHVAGKFSLYSGGFADGTGSAAKFNYQFGIATDAAGNVYMCDYSNYRIRKITPAGVVTTIAGNGTRGLSDGTGAAATFNFAHGLTADAEGNFYTLDGDETGLVIRKITSAGVVTTLPGKFNAETGFGRIHRAATGEFYIACRQDQTIYKYSTSKGFSLFAGSPGVKGTGDGTGSAASFTSPTGIVTDKAGNVYVSDQSTQRIRKITPAGVVTTLAGNGTVGADDGQGSAASFNWPEGLTIDDANNIYAADEEGKMVRKITPAGVVSTIYGKPNTAGNIPALSATFNQPTGVVADAAGNIYVADAGNNLIRKISAAGIVSVFVGSGAKGDADGNGTAASFNNPTGLTFDATGNMYVADYGNNELRKITAAGMVSSMPLFVAANGASGPDNDPSGVAVGPTGDIFYTNNVWGKICVIQGPLISTFSIGAYTGMAYGKFYIKPYGVAVDKAGNVYVADTDNHRIMKVNKDGRDIFVAGHSSSGNYPLPGSENGNGLSASFNKPKGIAVDAAGNMYVADTENNLIRKITPAGAVTTLAGQLTAGGVDGNASVASFNKPYGIWVNAAGTVLYVADTGNSLIRKITIQ
jgi:sugar lactone lactonase YvrE